MCLYFDLSIIQNAPLYTKSKGNRKRSLSENWLEHNPPDTVESGDLLQPRFKKKKTIVNPKAKHFKSKQVSLSNLLAYKKIQIEITTSSHNL